MIIEVLDESGDHIGSVCGKGDRWTAYTLDGNVIGQYDNQPWAEEAVRKADGETVVKEILGLIGIYDD